MTGSDHVCYNPGLGCYLLGNYSFVDPQLHPRPIHQLSWPEAYRSQLTLFEAPEPWGPWSLFYQDDDWGTYVFPVAFPVLVHREISVDIAVPRTLIAPAELEKMAGGNNKGSPMNFWRISQYSSWNNDGSGTANPAKLTNTNDWTIDLIDNLPVDPKIYCQNPVCAIEGEDLEDSVRESPQCVVSQHT